MYSHREQKNYLETLKKFERNFTSKEMNLYKLLIKRDKDEEEFDSVAMKKLKELHDKYIKPVDMSKYDKFFKKNNDTDENK
ncbi:MAG: hypothetical protein ACHQLA_01495 [Ignavibacteriales bacterium]